MRLIIIISLFVSFGLHSNAQLGYDIAPKITSYKINRFQLEQRFHFENIISVVMSFGCNREKSPGFPKYYYHDYGTEMLILNHYIVNYQQIKIGLQRDIVNDRMGSKIYIGGTIGYNYAKQKHFHVPAPLTFEYNKVTEEHDLVYKPRRFRRNWDLVDTDRIRHLIYEGFIGTDLEFMDHVALTLGLHCYVNYVLSDFSPMAPYYFGFKANVGLRFRIFGDL